MPGCVAAWCTNSSSKGFKMCNFPRNKERRDAWVKNMNRQGWSPTPYSALCEVHFAPDMWEKVRIDGKKKLKTSAVPTLFVTKCMYLLLNEKKQEIPVKRRSILDSITILRRKSKYSAKEGGELQKEGDRQSCKNQVTNNGEANDNEFEDAYDAKFEQLEALKTISHYFKGPLDSINDGT